MSLISRKNINGMDGEANTSFPLSITSNQSWRRLAVIVQQATFSLTIVGLSSLLIFSVMNDKLFFSELLICSFIIITLVFFQASAKPQK
jgi:ammonia channel protein AmtB